MFIYLISGFSYKLVEQEINKVLKDNSNLTNLNWKNISINEILSEASYYSLFAEEKCLIVKNADFFANEKLTEKEEKNLIEYLENPNPATSIIFITYQKIDLRKKITKLIKNKYHLIEIPQLKNNEVIEKIVNYTKNKMYEIEYDTVQYIAQQNNYNYDLIINEIDKLILYYNKPGLIKMVDVQNITSSLYNDNNFKFVEAVINKNIDVAFKYYHDLIKLKVEPIALINLLAREYRLTYMVGYLNKGQNSSMIAKSLGMQSWQINKYIKQTYNYTLDELLAKLKALGDLDFKIKSGKIDKFLGIRLFLLEIAQ